MKKMIFLLIGFMIFSNLLVFAETAIVDSEMTFSEAIAGTNAPKSIISELKLIDVEYYSFDNKLHKGQLLLNSDLVDDVVELFKMFKAEKFLIAKCIPIVKYNWSDSASMEDNNTSAFNYRFVAGTKNLSNHAKGRAIDINPVQNPAVYNNGKVSPEGAKYNPKAKGTLIENSSYVQFMIKNKWRWGGTWTSLKDYQHFDSPQ